MRNSRQPYCFSVFGLGHLRPLPALGCRSGCRRSGPLPAHCVAPRASREWPLSPIAADAMPQPHGRFTALYGGATGLQRSARPTAMGWFQTFAAGGPDGPLRPELRSASRRDGGRFIDLSCVPDGSTERHNSSPSSSHSTFTRRCLSD